MVRPQSSRRTLVVLLTLVLGAAATTPLSAANDAVCLTCHNERAWPAVREIFETPHGVATDPRAPAAGAGCGACHLAGEHPRRPTVAPADVEGACLGCHREAARHWETGVHAAEGLVCGDCHQIHTTATPVLERDTQAGACYDCHRDVRMQANLPSRHPIREGLTICTDCHDAHGSLKRASLTGINLNASCLECHDEQRGPWLFEHQPVADDCSNCHVPHGAVHDALLARRAPQLCQQCHLANFHPSTLNAGGGLPGARPSANLLGRNCLSCHPKVHGSNHPSGGRLTR